MSKLEERIKKYCPKSAGADKTAISTDKLPISGDKRRYNRKNSELY